MIQYECIITQVFVVCHSSDDPTRGLMYRTTNGGKDFIKIRTDFIFGDEFVFHPDPDMANYILVRSNTKVGHNYIIYMK